MQAPKGYKKKENKEKKKPHMAEFPRWTFKSAIRI